MISRSFLFVSSIFLFSGCHDSIDGFFADPLFPGQKTFKASLFIEVFDSQNKPVQDALVSIGNIRRETDADGFLFAGDILLGESSYLTVSKEGFFMASRRFYPSPDKSQYIRIMLLPESRSTFFTAATGGRMELDNLKITFPSDGYTYENTESYQGVVVVSAQSIPADDKDLSFKMPGNLIGLDENGTMVSLGSFGMFVVSLKSPSGENLQLKQGMEAQFQLKVPSSCLATAPSTIPLWHFDDVEGIWKEEGNAVLSDNVYSAQVKHFSFWNCDYPFLATKWNSTFIYDDGSPVSQVKVCLTIIDLNVITCGYTNENGQTSDFVPSNKVFRIEVTDPCEDIIYTGEIGPFNDSLVTDLFTIPKAGLKMSTLTGTAVSCERETIKNLYAKIDLGNYSFFKSFSGQQGDFSIQFANCDESNVTLTLLDSDRLKFNAPQTFNYAPLIDAGTINVCEGLLEYVLIQLDSFPEYVIFNSVEYGHGGDGYYFKASDSTHNNFFIITKKTSEGNYPNTSCGISLHLYIDSVLSSNTCNLTITHFGNPGELIQGTFKGNFDWVQNENRLRSGFTGSFSVLRK